MPIPGTKVRYTIGGIDYVSVTQVLGLDPEKHKTIAEWEEKMGGKKKANKHRDQRSFIGSVIHYRIECWFCRRFGMAMPGGISLKYDDGRSAQPSDFTDKMKLAIDVIWSYFEEWAEEVTASGELVPIYIEKKVWHEELRYAGTIDMVAKYKGEVCLFDWKTAGFLIYDHSYGAQLAAYERACVRRGILPSGAAGLYVVRINEGDEGVDIHRCARDWPKFEACLNRYYDIAGLGRVMRQLE